MSSLASPSASTSRQPDTLLSAVTMVKKVVKKIMRMIMKKIMRMIMKKIMKKIMKTECPAAADLATA